MIIVSVRIVQKMAGNAYKSIRIAPKNSHKGYQVLGAVRYTFVLTDVSGFFRCKVCIAFLVAIFFTVCRSKKKWRNDFKKSFFVVLLFCSLVKICFWRYKIQFISGIYTVLPSTGLLLKKNIIFVTLIITFIHRQQKLLLSVAGFVFYNRGIH